MEALGNKIRELRAGLGMTQENLAEELGIAVKSVQRYEAEKSRPDTYTLAKLAVFFEVSADYLLGISGLKIQNEEVKNKILKNGEHSIYYKNYLKNKNEYVIDRQAEYYWICAKDHGIGGQTQWAGWTDETMKTEIRVLRTVIPDVAIDLCTLVYENPMVLNTEDDVKVFLVFGGQAIVRRDVCEAYLPWFLEPFTAESGDK